MLQNEHSEHLRDDDASQKGCVADALLFHKVRLPTSEPTGEIHLIVGSLFLLSVDAVSAVAAISRRKIA